MPNYVMDMKGMKDQSLVRFTCLHCGEACEADLHDQSARQYRCPTCKSLTLLPDLLDYALSGGDTHRIYILPAK